jgi:hypothetical protein
MRCRSRSLSILLLLLLGVASAVAAVAENPTPEPWREPLDIAIRNGLPDVRKARLVRGMLRVTYRGSGGHSEDINGIHAHLADGSWLIGLWRTIPPHRNFVVDASQTQMLPRNWTLSTLKRNQDDRDIFRRREDAQHLVDGVTNDSPNDTTERLLDTLAELPLDLLHHPVIALHLLALDQRQMEALMPLMDRAQEALWNAQPHLVLPASAGEKTFIKADLAPFGSTVLAHDLTTISRRILIGWFIEQMAADPGYVTSATAGIALLGSLSAAKDLPPVSQTRGLEN